MPLIKAHIRDDSDLIQIYGQVTRHNMTHHDILQGHEITVMVNKIAANVSGAKEQVEKIV
jgi:hypothetical protein